MATLTSFQPLAKDLLFPFLTGKDLLRLCQINKGFAIICGNDEVWQRQVIKEYPQAVSDKSDEVSWRNYYLSLINQPITVYDRGQITIIPWLDLDDFFANFTQDDLDTTIAVAMDNLIVVEIGPIPNVVDNYRNYNTLILLDINQDVKDLMVTDITSLHQTRQYDRSFGYRRQRCHTLDRDRINKIFTIIGLGEYRKGLLAKQPKVILCQLIEALRNLYPYFFEYEEEYE